jgi:LuxR family maltose regulon positive regulatory protein
MVRTPSAKAMVPTAPVGFVTRMRLLDQLDRAPEQSLVLVCAPPGYGKTSLLADWIVQRAMASAWLTLDDDDNDPRRLWLGVLGAVAASAAVAADSAVRRLLAEPPTSVPELSSEIIYALDDLPAPIRLVLDDVDELVAPDALDELRTLVRHRPGGLRLVLSSRLDPPLSLPRLRLEGRLYEIRVDRLRFTPGEAKVLLDTAGAHLDDGQIATLHTLTDGWAAALRLAAISLRNAADPGASLAAFSGDERSVAEYLVGEILSGFSPEVLDFLGATSVCDVFPPELAADLSGRQDAADVLDRLERETSVVAKVDPRRPLYRMQPLLRSYVRADLERGMPARASALHDRAAAWWADRDDPVKALTHVGAAGHPSMVAELVRRFALRLLGIGAHPLLRSALRRLDEEERTRDPWLALTSALCHLESGELPEAEADVEHAERNWPENPTPTLDVLRAAARLLHSCQSHGIFYDRPRYRPGRSPLGDPAAAALAGLVEAIDQLPVVHDRAAARRGLTDAWRLAEQHGLGYLAMQCRTMLASYAAADGDYRSMAAISDDALAAAAANGWLNSLWASFGRAMLAHAALLRAEPAEARRHAAQGLRTGGAGFGGSIRYALQSLHGCALFDVGQRTAGFDEMLRARADNADRPLSRQQAAVVALLEYRAALTLGRPDAAATLEWLVARAGECGEVALMKAWGELSQGRVEAARAALAPVIAGETATLLSTTRAEALIADAECILTAEEPTAAVPAVTDALTVAARLDLVRPFVLAGPAVWDLLRAWPDGPGELRAFVDRALHARQTLHGPETGMQLSQREQTVLSLLPSLLSLEEISEDLSISVNTLKSHLRAIYLKLGVSSRRAAVVAAHERELLVTSLPLTH